MSASFFLSAVLRYFTIPLFYQKLRRFHTRRNKNGASLLVMRRLAKTFPRVLNVSAAILHPPMSGGTLGVPMLLSVCQILDRFMDPIEFFGRLQDIYESLADQGGETVDHSYNFTPPPIHIVVDPKAKKSPFEIFRRSFDESQDIIPDIPPDLLE